MMSSMLIILNCIPAVLKYKINQLKQIVGFRNYISRRNMK